MTNQFTHYNTERLRSIPITRVASQFGELKKHGSTFMALCPWHDDHHPSLSLVEKTGQNYCHCFSCGQGGDTIRYVEAAMNTDFIGACEWLSKQYGILTSSDKAFVPTSHRNTEQQANDNKPLDYIPTEMMEELVSVENSLCHCLLHWFHPEAVKWVVEEYRLGCYTMSQRDDVTIFPDIDRQGRVCDIKVQCYDVDPQSPKFGRSIKGRCYMLAKIWQRDGKLPLHGNYKAKCLFGEHLLPQNPARTIALVESPKNAVVGALEYPQMLWLAVGNKTTLQRKYLEPLRNRDVIVIPDRDAIPDWTKTINQMKDLANFTVSDFCLRVAPDDQPKYDIADYIIDQHRRTPQIP